MFIDPPRQGQRMVQQSVSHDERIFHIYYITYIIIMMMNIILPLLLVSFILLICLFSFRAVCLLRRDDYFYYLLLRYVYLPELFHAAAAFGFEYHHRLTSVIVHAAFSCLFITSHFTPLILHYYCHCRHCFRTTIRFIYYY